MMRFKPFSKPLHPRLKTTLIASAVLALGATALVQAQGVKYDFAYPLSGADRAKPSQVYDDGKLTYIQTKRGQGPFKVFAITRTGEKELTKRATENCSVDCVAVEGTYEELRFASEGTIASAKYSGGRQALAAGMQSYGSVQPMAQFGSVGSTTAPAPLPVANKALEIPPDLLRTASAEMLRASAAGAPMIVSAVRGVMPAPASLVQQQPMPTVAVPNVSPASTQAMGMVLGSNGQGQPSLALLSITGSPMPTLDGTVIDPKIKAGYQAKGTWVKTVDITNMRQSLEAMGKGQESQRLAGDYNFAKANCMTDLANDIHIQARNNGVTEHLLHSAAAHRNAAANNQITSYRTIELPGEILSGKSRYGRQNSDLWRNMAMMHQAEGARCAPAALACASVQLLGAEFKRGENYPKDALVYETKAKQMLASAEQAIQACPPLPVAAPVVSRPQQQAVPMPAPQPAPPVQLKLTKETLAGQTLFELDKATLTGAAINALRSFAERANAMYRSISSLTIEGHADRLGNQERNQPLSENRAAAVKNWLVNWFASAGKSPTIVNASGAGSSKPVTGKLCTSMGNKQTKALEDCLAPDRRVEISIIGDVATTATTAAPQAKALPMITAPQAPQAVQAPMAQTTAQAPTMSASSASASPGLSIEQQLAALDAQRNALNQQLLLQRQSQDKAQQEAAQQAAHKQALDAAQREGARVYKEMMDKAMQSYQARTPISAGPNLPVANNVVAMANFNSAAQVDAPMPAARFEPAKPTPTSQGGQRP